MRHHPNLVKERMIQKCQQADYVKPANCGLDERYDGQATGEDHSPRMDKYSSAGLFGVLTQISKMRPKIQFVVTRLLQPKLERASHLLLNTTPLSRLDESKV